ncbi:hypothetical protein M885DRAFT_562088 [Pelagophyceae sp. CCMP2097]|nr:hypothetical protein M885DRAFT_562088 [Pelagophyceae sp. CCMP2097]|mmetsp:Transcript_30014/g.105554  ORF Transcript_30014/g.105554 Transcript_30014/m.105554 type:complete len:502 (-) Transcript_30014:134-1639(-)
MCDPSLEGPRGCLDWLGAGGLGRYACSGKAAAAAVHVYGPWRALYYQHVAGDGGAAPTRPADWWRRKLQQCCAVTTGVPLGLEYHSALPSGLSGAVVWPVGGDALYAHGGAASGFRFNGRGMTFTQRQGWAWEPRIGGPQAPEADAPVAERRPGARWQHTATAAAGSVWVFGGESVGGDDAGIWRVDVCVENDKVEAKWRRVEPSAESDATAATAGHSCHDDAAQKRLLFLFGRVTRSAEAQRDTFETVSSVSAFHYETATWTAAVAVAGAVPKPRWCHSASTLKTETLTIAVFGGWDLRTKTFFDDVFILAADGPELQWSQVLCQPGPRPRCQAACFAIEACMDASGGGDLGSLLILGGACHDQSRDATVTAYGSLVLDLDDAWMIDLDTSAWSQVKCGGLNLFRGGCNATALQGGKRLVCGGMHSDARAFAPTFVSTCAEVVVLTQRCALALPDLGPHRSHAGDGGPPDDDDFDADDFADDDDDANAATRGPYATDLFL